MKRQSNGFLCKYRSFYVNVLQGGDILVRWDFLLVRWAKFLSVGAENLSVGLPFVAFFFFRNLQKKARPFFRRPRRLAASRAGSRSVATSNKPPTNHHYSHLSVRVRQYTCLVNVRTFCHLINETLKRTEKAEKKGLTLRIVRTKTVGAKSLSGLNTRLSLWHCLFLIFFCSLCDVVQGGSPLSYAPCRSQAIT